MLEFIVKNVPWISMVVVLTVLYKILNPLNKRFENPTIDERELSIRMKVEKVQWRVQASFLYLAVFMPLIFERPVFWGASVTVALNVAIFSAFAAKLLADYLYRRE